MQRSVFIKTFGCQMNAVDSARMLSLLSSADYRAAATLEEADLVLLNTCSIREKADQKIYSDLGTLRRWKQRRPGRLVGVGGCLAQQDGEALRARAPHVDIVFGTHNIANLPGMVRRAERRLTATALGMEDGVAHWDVVPYLPAGAVSAMVAIMQGCDNFCAYCVVPLVRGREVSRPSEDILSEVRALAARGVTEVVLLGQNVNSYGKKEGEIPFPELLLRISAIERISRIRFITSHPRDLDDRTIRLFEEISTLCPHVHLPLQSGSDRVLAAMGRGYTRGEYLARIEALRQVRPDMAFSSDFIVGFPGETEDDFRETLAVMEDIRFDSSFSFRFSSRPGTRAAEMKEKVDPQEAAARLRRLQELQASHTRERLAAQVGREVTVLVEGTSARDPGMRCGRTPCNKTVNFTSGSVGGPVRTVLVTGAGTHSLVGEERPSHA
ncbi:MAG TPA: tRNA (N6-isopentenyl adenosine(37)-C2)-methylthiotransferase MiaB [Thermodesulfobacteriota bacterium]|nr:tRNA (N6-isopentenyl adenosine(37)-C2)-methylthiotransferase MiaB [Thermodesulfobacteriota bacterium]